MQKIASESLMIEALKRRFEEANKRQQQYRREGNDAEHKFWLGRAAGLADALELLDEPFTR